MTLSKWLGVVLLFGPVLGLACAWDDDTLGIELRGKPTIQDALAGRVERYPKNYYEARIRIQTDRLAKNPRDLAAYDNIAVAYDRLGDSKQAIAWIQKKRPFVGENKEHQYRTEANEGTFWAHLWTQNGSRADQKSDLKKGRDMIAKAIKINPDAHFGRENAQLLVMDWSLNGKADESLLDYIHDSQRNDSEKLREGLAGLILLGVAWENPDITSSLALEFNDGSIAHLAQLRTEELKAAGKKSLTVLPEHYSTRPLHDPQAKDAERDFKKLRDNAKEFQANLTTFVNTKLEAGSHPDTDPNFWDGYEPTPRLTLSDAKPFKPVTQNNLAILGVGALLMAAILALAIRWKQRSKRA